MTKGIRDRHAPVRQHCDTTGVVEAGGGAVTILCSSSPLQPSQCRHYSTSSDKANGVIRGICYHHVPVRQCCNTDGKVEAGAYAVTILCTSRPLRPSQCRHQDFGCRPHTL